MNAPAAPPLALPAGDRRFPATLLIFGAVSLVAHAATFLVFQVAYPPRATIPPAATPVTLLSASDPDQQALLRWIESEDPALVAATAHPAPPHLFELEYHPSYMTPRTPPRTMPATGERPEPPPGPGLEVLMRSLDPAPLPASQKVPPAPTRLLFAGALQGRVLATKPVFRAAVATPLESAAFLLAVAPDGAVRYAVLQKSSGDLLTDGSALETLARQRFSPAPEQTDLAWGVATLIWGDDAYLRPEKTP